MRYEQGIKLARHYDTPDRPRRKGLAFSSLIVYAAILALVTGFGSAWWALDGAFPVGREKAGAWTYWPDIGSENIDPYALAMIKRDAMLPLGGSEGIELLATRDGAGALLNTACTYRLGSSVPHARYWTLTPYGINGGFLSSDASRSGFTSHDVVRNEDGSFVIALASQAQSGNWLPLAGQRRFVLVLRLYDVPATGGRTNLEPNLLPTIERVECLS